MSTPIEEFKGKIRAIQAKYGIGFVVEEKDVNTHLEAYTNELAAALQPEGEKRYTVSELWSLVQKYANETMVHGPGSPTLPELVFLTWLSNREKIKDQS